MSLKRMSLFSVKYDKHVALYVQGCDFQPIKNYWMSPVASHVAS